MLITREQWFARLRRCEQGKHKMRENKYGVVWCVNCGLLGKSSSGAELIKEEDKITVLRDPNWNPSEED